MSVAEPTGEAVAAADRAFFDALLSADRTALEVLLAPEFLIVDVANGGLTARADFLGFVESAQVTFDEIETFPADSVMRELGGTVVVIGRTRMAFTMPDGGTVRARSRYTHIFMPAADGRWQLASAQGTAIPSED